jgi:hypothetical protein
MDINIFLLCYNESSLLPHTIKHYKKYLPSCKITIYDNESTDNSVEIAKNAGCDIISWNSKNIIDDYKYLDIKNNCWKKVKNGWIIVADMDEFLCITEEELLEEYQKGTTILKVRGVDMIGESNTIDLSDINLQEINKYVDNYFESKKICFLRDSITDINYSIGAHNCNPQGIIKYSVQTYINKHMAYLGLNFIINKIIKRYERSHLMRSKGVAVHYTNDINKIKNEYNNQLQRSNTFI